MTPETLTRQIKAGDSAAIPTATSMGQSAAPTLEKLAQDKDPDVRLWSLRCFDAIGGDAAISAALARLVDEDPQVASMGVVVLHHHPPKGRGAELRGAFGAAKETFVRAEIPKIAGRVATPDDMKVWLVILPTVTEAEVRDGVMIGLARMGHQESRDWFASRLSAADGPKALPWLEAAEYMEDPWIVPTLAKLLDKKSAVYTVSADYKPTDIRICDLAAYTIFKLTSAKVDFRVAKRRYNEVEIDAARAGAAGATK